MFLIMYSLKYCPDYVTLGNIFQIYVQLFVISLYNCKEYNFCNTINIVFLK